MRFSIEGVGVLQCLPLSAKSWSCRSVPLRHVPDLARSSGAGIRGLHRVHRQRADPVDGDLIEAEID
jgi:hypothetical protein